MGQLSESLARIGRELWDLQGSVPPEQGYEVLRERLNELALGVVVLSRETRGGVLVGGQRISWELMGRIAADQAKVGKVGGRPMKKRRTGGSGNLRSGRRPGG
jgi:hypothetical protein